MFWCKKQIQNRGTSQDIQLFNTAPRLTWPLQVSVCQLVKDKKERHYFSRKQANTTVGIPQYPRKVGISLPEYLILQGRSEFVLSIQNSSLYQAKRHIFNRTPNFYCSQPRLYYSKYYIPRQKHIAFILIKLLGYNLQLC